MVKPLKIGILMQATTTWMGGVVYIQNLVKAISSLPLETRTQIELHLIISPDSDPEFWSNLIPLVDSFYIADYLSCTFLNKIRRKLAKIAPSSRGFLLNSSRYTEGEKLDFYYPIIGQREFLWDSTCRWAAWIPDFQHKYLPEFFSSTEITQRNQGIQRITKQAPALVFSSHVALNDYQKFYPDSCVQTFVLNFRTMPESEWFKIDPITIQMKYNLPDIFFLVSNQFWIHKNHKIIIQALKLLKQEKITPAIICTGKIKDHRFPEYGDELLELIHSSSLETQFYLLGLIPRIEQIQLMRRCLAIIQPSLFEGWSTVVEDARLLGKVLILSDLPVHLEQNPPKAMFFSRHSVEALAEQIKLAYKTLTPGPKLKSEADARHLSFLERQNFAETFLRIAQSCSELTSVRL